MVGLKIGEHEVMHAQVVRNRNNLAAEFWKKLCLQWTISMYFLMYFDSDYFG